GVALGVAFGVAGGVACILGALRFYFWLPEFLWMLILYFVLSRHRDGGKWLGYLPPRFDEKIILLLPFIDKLIIKAYRESPSVARETIDYLINSTNQQKVAAQAMAGITIDNLSRCQTLGDIAEIPNQLNWIPSPAPKELGNALPQLLDISQDVKAAVAATSPSRQTELLNRPISALRKLQNSLTFEQNPQLATGYRQITDPWLAILETAQRTLQEKAQQRQEIIQVYIAGNALDPETAEHRFKGRIDIFREIETLSLADQPPVLLLYGGRRAGKTSALKYLPYKVDSTLVPLLVDLQGAASATTLSGLAENLATQIIETARRLPQRLDLPYPKEIKTDPFIALQNWLGEIERTYPSKRFLLNLDEFERLSEVVEATGSRVPLNFLRNVLQHRRQWTLLFSGSHEVAELPSYWNDYLINTRTIRVSFLDEESARELILEPVENFPTIYTPEAVNEIIKLTRCQPYLVQLMCYEVIELLNRDIRENKRELEAICRDAKFRVSITDVQAVIPTVLERGDQYFRELWTSLQKSDQNFLRRLIQGKTPTAQDKGIWKSLQENEQNFLRRLIQGQIPTAQDQGIVKKLIRKEIVTPEGNALQIPLVQRFIKQVLEETNN
ncbi:AAA family ATPase, partial [Westiellopsis prolifica IICB1]